MNIPSDARGNPVSCSDPDALAAFERALQQYQSYVGDPVATIEGALAARPDFVMGHVFRAGVLMTFAEARFAEMARASVAQAEQLGGNSRERALTAATRKLVDGDWAAACAAFDRVLVDHPRDAFTIQTAHLFDFLRGDTKNLRDRVARVLPAWTDRVPGYSYVLGMHAFGLEECNQYSDARATAERALAIEPRDGWAIHAAVHCCEMQGQIDDGVAFLEDRRAHWSVDNGFAFHNSWHLALFHHDRGDTAKVLELFDTVIFPDGSDVAYQFVDATALLWRLHLEGVDVRSRAERVAAAWKPSERRFYAFNDVHALLAYVMAEQPSDAILAALEAHEIGAPIARGILAFTEGHHARAIDELAGVRDRAHGFGGSHAQRDILTLTMIEAALRGKAPSIARHYLAERLVSRPRSRLGSRLAARAA